MRNSLFHPRRGGLWLAVLTALVLAGCGGGTHTDTRTHDGTTVGVNLNGTSTPGASVKATDTPNLVTIAPPRSLSGSARVSFRQGEQVAEQSGCLGCHVIGADGNNGPGPELTHIGARLSRVQITRTLIHPTPPMPSFAALPKSKLNALTAFLSDLR